MGRQSYRVQFENSSGFSLAGIIDRPEDQIPGPVAVFSHCFTCNKDLKAIVRISRGLAERGIAVLRYDMTGLGGSQGDFSKTNFTTNLADLEVAIRFAASELPGPISLLGHSFGGAASLAIAGILDPSRPPISTIATLAAPSDTQHLAALLSRMNPAIDSEGLGTVSIGGIQWTIDRQMLEDFRAFDLPAKIPEIQCPVLLLQSPVDETVTMDHALRIMGLIQNAPSSSAAVSLLSLDNADHLLARDPADIEYVTDVIAAFINRHTKV